MAYRFNKHYNREEARALLPQIQNWLRRLNEQRLALEQMDARLDGLRPEGQDLGGGQVNKQTRIVAEIRELLLEFHNREIMIKDLPRGLIDFPAVIGGREVFLCWEMGEQDIEFWHDIDSGFAGREPL
jgi:hypothetical protein